MNLFDLTAKLTLDTSNYDKGIKEAKKGGEDFAEHADKKVKTKAVLAWAAITAAVVALVKRLKDLIITTANYADQVGDLADKWGVSTREIQEFDYWASQNGTTLENVLNAMTRLTNQAQVNADAFKELGISVRDNEGNLKGQKQLFLEVASALNQIENQTQRNALQFDIFGRSGTEISQVLKQGREELERLSDDAEQLGIILSETTIKKASDFNDELDRLRMQGRSAFAELIAGADGAEERFDAFISNLEEKIEILAPVFFKIGEMLGREILKGILKSLVDRFWGMLKFTVGEGWLWGEKIWDKKYSDPIDFLASPMGSTSSITNSVVNEKTTKVDEKLDITLSVESDGTVAGEKNLDILSDLMVEKINKTMGDMING